MNRSLIGSFDFAPGMMPDNVLFSAISSLLIWIPVGILTVLVVAGIVVWRTRRRWPVMAVLYQKIGRHPFAKYILLSVVAHIVLVAWLLSSSLLSPPPGPAAPPVFVQFGDEARSHSQLQANRETTAEEDRSSDAKAEPKPWEVSTADAVSPPKQELPDVSPEPSKPVERKVAPPKEPAPRKQVPIPASLPEAAFAQRASTPAAFAAATKRVEARRNQASELPDSLPPDLSTPEAPNPIASLQTPSVNNQASALSSNAKAKSPLRETPRRNLASKNQQFAATDEQLKSKDVPRTPNIFQTRETSSLVDNSNTRFSPKPDSQSTAVNHSSQQFGRCCKTGQCKTGLFEIRQIETRLRWIRRC